MENNITEQQFNEFKKNPTASWAIYNDIPNRNSTSDDFITYFFKNITSLKCNIIFVGINPSGKECEAKSKPQKIFSNFHNHPSVGGDRLLKECFEDSSISKKIQGALMIDISHTNNSIAADIDIKNSDINYFKKQLTILNVKKYYIICSGRVVFEKLAAKLSTNDNIKSINKRRINERMIEGRMDDKNIILFGINQFSNAARYIGRREPFKERLKKINQMIE